MRYKKTGWFRDSHRHALAARGISTKYFSHKGAFSQFLHEAKNGKMEEEDKSNMDYYQIIDQRQTATTDKYYAEKDPDEQSLFQNDKMLGMGKDLRRRDIAVLQDSVLRRLDDAVARGELTAENRERFIRENFRKESEEYLNGRQDKQMFDARVNSDLNNFMKINARKFSFGKVMEGKS